MVGLLAAVMATTGMLGAEVATAAVPTFPDNLVVFPNRDFVVVEGYASHQGETATVTVTRPSLGNQVIGSAQGVVSGGDVAFEINHPGGVCWGAGTDLKITPDILPDDVAAISFAGQAAGETRVQDGYVTGPATLTGSTLTVTGHFGPNVNKDNAEQRIVEPALASTSVARRDVRATPGPLTPAPKGGYSSSLAFGVDGPDTFTATYVFDDPAVAQIAANAGGERLLTWEFTDAAANRQGITIAERGELGGPGFGGCPNGPLQSGPAAPTSVSAVKVAGGVKLTWTPAVAIAGTPAITGYRARAIAQTISSAGEQNEAGKRITGAGAKGTVITGLSSTESYDIEVVSVSSVGETYPPVPAVPVTDVTPPTVASTPGGGTYPSPTNVTLSANEAGSQIYYTTNSVDPVVSDSLDPTATLYTGPITVSADTDLRFVAFDPAGNVSIIGNDIYVITNTPSTPKPAAPTVSNTSVGPGSVTLDIAAADPSITSFTIQASTAAGDPVGGPRVTTVDETTARKATIAGLTGDVPVYFTVSATNPNGTSEPCARVGPLTPQGAVVANAGPDQSIVRKPTATTVNLSAEGSSAGATYAWVQVTPGTTEPMPTSNPDFVTITGAATANPSFSLRLFKHPMTNNALTFRLTVTSAAGSISDETKVVPVPDTVAISTARWKLGDFRVVGTSSVVGGTITVHKGTLAGASLGQSAVTAAAAPAVGGVFSVRSRSTTTPLNTNPATVWIESSLGGTAGPFPVTAG